MSDRLSADLEALFEREARAYAEDPALKASVLAGVESAVAVGGVGVGSMVAKSASTAKAVAVPMVVAIGMATFVAGASVGYAIHPSVVTPLSSTNVTTMPNVVPSSLPSAPPPPSTIIVPVAPTVLTSSASASPTPSFEEGDLVREREMLDVARAALAHGHPADAVAEAQRHERRWPRGYLAEEREVVWIQALVAEGMLTDADARAAKFHVRFPRSALSGAVDAAIGANSDAAMTDSGTR